MFGSLAWFFLSLGSSYASQVLFVGKELSTPSPDSPSSPLPWGDINVLHTTDIHGWIRGHSSKASPEINYSANLGDVRSFFEYMKEKAVEQGQDLLIVDTGDHHDGNAISDLDEPKGHQSLEIVTKMPYDLLATGNHELYNYTVAVDTYSTAYRTLDRRYLASNVDIYIPSISSQPIPFGARYRRFKTAIKQRTITSFGFIYDFNRQDRGIYIKHPADTIKEPWFEYALSLPTDVFVLVGHMPVGDQGWSVLHDAIRSVHPKTPILMLGGHAHIRDCEQLDENSMVLASGRYLETVGWMSVENIDAHKIDRSISLKFNRRYLDNNKRTYQYHTGTTDSTFKTDEGIKISRSINTLADSFNLDKVVGHVPQNYYIERAPVSHVSSLFHLFVEEVMPYFEKENQGNKVKYIVNTGAFRFDLYKGPFTLDTRFLVLPFENMFMTIRNVPATLAEKLLPRMNEIGEESLSEFQIETTMEARMKIEAHEIEIEKVRRKNNLEAYQTWLRSPLAKEYAHTQLSEGYVTKDKCGGPGDDTIHRPLEVYEIPAFVGSNPEIVLEDHVDLVFFEFILPYVLNALNALGPEHEYTANDTARYGNFKAHEVLEKYARAKWNM